MKIKFYLFILKLIRRKLIKKQKYQLAGYCLDIKKQLKNKENGK